jgi:carbamoyltransferase
VKHWAGFPSQAIQYCLEERHATVSDLDFIAVNQDNRVNVGRKIAHVVRFRPDIRALWRRIRNRRDRASIDELLGQSFPLAPWRGRVRFVEHHLSHLASAYLVSPFREAVAVSVDGFGDFASAAWGVGTGTHLTVDGRVFFPHSLGVFYQALTVSGLNYGDEYKSWVWAPYGERSTSVSW